MPTERAMNIAIFLDDVNEFNGPLMFIPGSHKKGVIDAKHVGRSGEAEILRYTPAGVWQGWGKCPKSLGRWGKSPALRGSGVPGHRLPRMVPSQRSRVGRLSSASMALSFLKNPFSRTPMYWTRRFAAIRIRS